MGRVGDMAKVALVGTSAIKLDCARAEIQENKYTFFFIPMNEKKLRDMPPKSRVRRAPRATRRVANLGRPASLYDYKLDSPGLVIPTAPSSLQFKFMSPDMGDAKEYNFACALNKMKCIGKTTKGVACSRMSTQTLPYCWQHMQKNLHVAIAPTKLTDANGRLIKINGLFARAPDNRASTIVFKKNEKITPYFGERITKKELDQRYHGDSVAPYVVKNMERAKFFDLACTRGVGAWSNMCLSRTCKNNAELLEHQDVNTYPIMQATRNIKHNDEILCNYGPAYFSDDERGGNMQATQGIHSTKRKKK